MAQCITGFNTDISSHTAEVNDHDVIARKGLIHLFVNSKRSAQISSRVVEREIDPLAMQLRERLIAQGPCALPSSTDQKQDTDKQQPENSGREEDDDLLKGELCHTAPSLGFSAGPPSLRWFMGAWKPRNPVAAQPGDIRDFGVEKAGPSRVRQH